MNKGKKYEWNLVLLSITKSRVLYTIRSSIKLHYNIQFNSFLDDNLPIFPTAQVYKISLPSMNFLLLDHVWSSFMKDFEIFAAAAQRQL